MKSAEFVKKAKEQDWHNIFQCGKACDNMPIPLLEFYSEYDPVDVEVNMEGSVIRFVPRSDYESVQQEYNLGDEKGIFATCNGDPIFLYKGAVFTCPHGERNPQYELLASSLENYFDKIQ